MVYFGVNIRKLREHDGHKIAEMTAITGFPRSTWNGYETGDSYPKFEDLIKISDYFGILESDLLHRDFIITDLPYLFNAYLQIRKDIQKEGNSPPSKAFKTYLSGNFSAIALRLSGTSVTDSVTKPVTIDPKKHKKGILYDAPKIDLNHLILNEEQSEYSTGTVQGYEARIARLERIIAALKHALNGIDIP